MLEALTAIAILTALHANVWACLFLRARLREQAAVRQREVNEEALYVMRARQEGLIE